MRTKFRQVCKSFASAMRRCICIGAAQVLASEAVTSIRQENENLARHLHIEGASDANGIDRRALGPAASSATGTEYGRHFVLPSCNRSVQPLRLSQRAFLVPAGSDVRIQSSLTGIWFTAQDSTSRRPATRPKLQTRFASTTRHWPALKLTLRSGTSSEDGRRCPFQQELS
jgi:hypothetical protein